MTKRNLEDIDQLFREGLHPGEVLVTFQEGEWSKLKQRLDRHERKKRGLFWLSRLGGVAALILLFFAIRILWPEGTNQVIQQAEVQQKDQNKKPEQYQSITSPKGKEIVSTTKPRSKVPLAQNKPPKVGSAQQRSIASRREKQMTDHDTIGMESLKVQKATTAANASSTEHSLNQTTLVESADRKLYSAADSLREENLTGQKATTESKVRPKEQPPTQPELAKSPERNRSSADEPLFAAIGEPNEQPISEPRMRRLALSVLAAPDYNGVNNLNNASLGNDFGLLVSYRIAKNWSFSTGGIYAKKLYETAFGNYTPTRNIWTEYFPKSVSADCRVLDIPLNINYTFLRRKNKTISAGSGISSYMMLREDYRFNYAQNDNNSPLSYHVANENQHWLGVLNLQASFEQRLSSRVSIGLQPYMKIPFKDIGFAGVRLQSFGMAANLSWNFNL
ncbi:MAG TPA: hypothetical protein DCL77_08835 [Prolixibacteraceae bacterium]|jgi:hypothetical protein|nr:hypothetical protein [Prolixibacteraceae bacterium]